MPRALYIGPVLPRRDGVGLQRRAYRVIEALSHRYRVSILTTERIEAGRTAMADAAAMCEEVAVRPPRRWTPPAIGRRALRRFLPAAYYTWYRRPSDWQTPSRADRLGLKELGVRDRFDLVYVHRLYMLPLLRSCPGLAHLPAFMDLDDVESITRARLARLARLNGDRRLAVVFQRDAEAYRILERRELARFDRVFVCSEIDRIRLLARGGPRHADVLPNVVEIPRDGTSHCEPRPAGDPFVFLFVGTLDYYPNRDAIAFFCRDVAPLLRARTARRFEIRVVAAGTKDRRRSVPDLAELSWAPPDADLGREYGRADAAIVPTRAGGGTRIKALEAFAHRTAVVATAVGVEGLDVRHGEHTLIGNTAADLAAHAAALMDDAALRQRLTERAFALVRTTYSPAALRRRLDDVHEAGTRLPS